MVGRSSLDDVALTGHRAKDDYIVLLENGRLTLRSIVRFVVNALVAWVIVVFAFAIAFLFI